MDADLRKGRLARAFSLTVGRGIERSFDARPRRWTALCWKFPGMTNLSILPAGR